MSDEKNLKQAQTVYETICSMLDNRKWKYTRHDEDLVITCGVSGDDLPMELLIAVQERTQTVLLYSPMPSKVPEDKRAEMAVAVCIANNGMINGSFDYDLSDGDIRFRITNSYRGSILSEELFDYMLNVAVITIDDYNDKFLMLSKGMMTLEQLIQWEEDRRNG